MDAAKTLIFSLLLLTFSISMTSAQDASVLSFGIPVQGEITPGISMEWLLSVPDGAVVSIFAQRTSGNLDPLLQVLNNIGTPIISNDDYNYPGSRDALLEAVTFSRGGSYTIRVSGVDNSAGQFTLIVLPGYSVVAGIDNFNGATTWIPATELDAFTTENSGGHLKLMVEGVKQTGVALNPAQSAYGDVFAQVMITTVSGRNGWLAGFALRYQSPTEYYLIIINHQGLWRLTLEQNGSSTVLRDWTPHPAIVAGEAAFSLGVLMNGGSFEIFYNGQFIGSVNDVTLPAIGQIGLMGSTVDAIGSSTVVEYEDFIVTAPLQLGTKGVFPQQITANSSSTIVQSLQRQRVIPALGEQALNVPTSTWQAIRPGVNRFTLARGTRFTNFVIGTTVSWQVLGTGTSGCGLLLRDNGETDFTLAYIDSAGGYGLSRRTGDEFEQGLFGENAALIGRSAYQMVIVANEGLLYYFIDGQYVGSLANAPSAGEVGNAVVNFDPVDTTCQFTDTWLWRLE